MFVTISAQQRQISRSYEWTNTYRCRTALIPPCQTKWIINQGKKKMNIHLSSQNIRPLSLNQDLVIALTRCTHSSILDENSFKANHLIPSYCSLYHRADPEHVTHIHLNENGLECVFQVYTKWAATIIQPINWYSLHLGPSVLAAAPWLERLASISQTSEFCWPEYFRVVLLSTALSPLPHYIRYFPKYMYYWQF